jgi:hypothetical protein
MEDLLRNDFTAHYNLPVATIANIFQQTEERYFEILDDENREVQISTIPDSGQAIYDNSHNKFLIGVINYDKFFTSLDHAFQRGRKRCDVIVYTINQNAYFLLNELKESNQQRKSPQLKQSLKDLLDVPMIAAFVNSFRIKRCCFFNKKIQSPPPVAPPSIRAITAFNQIQTILVNGFQVSNPEIEALGFSYYKYYAEQRCILS